MVKELVENAIDAAPHASHRGAARTPAAQLIRVTDDGVGMTRDEVDLALLRHATSKLATDADLEAIATLGFRGEALPAICAVTRFSVLSCPRGAGHGDARARRRGRGRREAARARARRHHRRGAGSLLQYARPAQVPEDGADASWRRRSGSSRASRSRTRTSTSASRTTGKAVLSAPRARSLRDRLGALRGFDLRRAAAGRRSARGRPPRGLRPDRRRPSSARGNRDEITLIVNGRPVRDTLAHPDPDRRLSPAPRP